MAEQNSSIEDLATLIKQIREATDHLTESQTDLKELNGLLGASGGSGATPAVIDDAEQVVGAAAEFSETLREGARALATSVEAVETAAKEAVGEAGFPPASALMASAATAFAAVSASAVQDMTTQGEALRDEALAVVLKQMDGAAESCGTAEKLVLAKMESLRQAAKELLSGLTESHASLARMAGDAATVAEQQAEEIPAATEAAVEATGAACHGAATSFATRRSELETIFTQRQGELDAQASRLEDSVSTLLSQRTAEACGVIDALSGPVEAAVGSALPACNEELGLWRTSLHSLGTAAEGLDTVADELTRARRVMEVSNATLDTIGQG